MVSYFNNQINDICTSVTTLLLHCLGTVHTGRGQHRNDLNYLTLNQNTQSIRSLSQRELSPPDCAIKVMKYHLTFLESKYSWRVLVSFFLITPYLGQLITEWNKSLKDIFLSHKTFFFSPQAVVTLPPSAFETSKWKNHQDKYHQTFWGAERSVQRCHHEATAWSHLSAFYFCCIVQKIFGRCPWIQETFCHFICKLIPCYEISCVKLHKPFFSKSSLLFSWTEKVY